MRQWTKEEKERQAALIRVWKPWEHSKGPKTKEGKGKASMNAYRHGGRSAEWVEQRKFLNELLRAMKEREEVAE